jgi:polyribonucleotide nucleotidyltransferase
MNLNFPVFLESEFYGKAVKLQTGLLAKQASASVIATMGETNVMATVVIGAAKLDLDYFPLQVIFEERMYASGKIRGSRFQKREGRPTESAILSGRLVDRSLRSLFNDNLKNDIQIIITPLSIDEVNQPDVVAVLAASTAIRLAGISKDLFKGSVSCTRVGKVAGSLTVFPTYEELKTSTIDISVSANAEGVCMLEAGMNLVSESELIESLELGEKVCQELNKFQEEFLAKAESFDASFGANSMARSRALVLDEKYKEYSSFFASDLQTITDLIYGHSYQSEKNESLITYLNDKLQGLEDPENNKYRRAAFYKIVKEVIQTRIVKDGIRPDKRGLDEIRPLSSNVAILPMVHGSSLFNRGATQVMNILTLGTLRDALLSDDMEDFEETTKRYMHHYNFPSYSVGETGRYGAPSRREIGHGALAEKALLPVIPSEGDFPYTMRLVSECLGSNGSTSMASTCASTLALMDAGVPIKEPIAGIAMGVVANPDNLSEFRVLTDIQGMEDHYGHMDFKVTGGKSGLTALQLDNKLSGISLDILKIAIGQAQIGLQAILASMEVTISASRPELSQYAPLVEQLDIPYDKVGDVIGSQGKIIKAIIAKTNTEIDIADNSGKTTIYGKNQADVRAAKEIILGIIKEYAVGEIIDLTLTREVNFGFFGTIDKSDKEALLHVRQIPQETKGLKIGDTVKVKVIGFNDKKQMDISMRM